MRRLIKAVALLASLLLPALGGGRALAQPAPARALTAADAEVWLDGAVDTGLRQSGVPGAVVVIVKDGQVLLEKGYGVANAATGAPVDPQRTLMRGGSVSKLFTWTAVMQLVEQGKLDLDADLNTYLDFKIPPFEGRPVTMRNIMTHTGGFEEARRGIVTQDPKHVPPLGEALKRWTPRRVFAPGSTPGYSNYAAALAGYVVERVSGEPYDVYVDRHIFAPLDMNRSTFAEPLSAAQLKDAASGYMRSGAPASDFELVVWKPAGALSTTGDDMSRFMLAHLQGGAYGGKRILSPATTRMMQTKAWPTIAPLNSMLLGFYQQNINGHRVVGHAGDTVLFHSLMMLYPDDGVGIFMSFNGLGAGGAVYGLRQQLFEQFSERYFANTASADGRVDFATAKAHARMFAGAYYSSRASQSSFLSAMRLLSPAKVKVWQDGTISVSQFKDTSGAPSRFVEISPFVWRQVGGHDRLAAIVKDGRIIRFSTDQFSPALVLDAVPFWKSPVLLNPAVMLSTLVLLATALGWPIVAFVRRRYGATYPHQGQRARAQRLVRIGAVLMLLAIGGWLWLLTKTLIPGGTYLLGDYEGRIYLIQGLTIVAFIGGFLAATYNLVVVWRTSSTWPERVWGLVLALSSFALLYTGWIYNLLRINVQF